MTDLKNDGSAEVARLRAERDALKAELERLQPPPRQGGWLRRTSVVVLVALACVSFTAAVPGVWARRNFLDTDRFVDRVGPLVDDPAVQEALTARLTSQLMLLIDPRALFEEVLPERGQLLAVPLANAVEGFVADRVANFVASDRFERLWVGAVNVAHETAVKVLKDESEVVTATEGEVTLNLIPVVDAVLAEITAASPEILGREVEIPDVSVEDIPEAAIARLETALDVDLDESFGQFTVYDDGKLAAAQEAVKLFDRLVLVLLPASVVFAAAALWLSRSRRRTLLQLATGVIIGMVLIRRVAFGLQDDVAALPPTDTGDAAAEVAVATFLDPLLTFALWAGWAAIGVAAVALLTGSYGWAVALRRRTVALGSQVVAAAGSRSRDEATVVYVREHRDALLAGGALVGLALLWAVDLSWFGLLVVLAAIAAFELVVYRIGEPAPTSAPPPSTP